MYGDRQFVLFWPRHRKRRRKGSRVSRKACANKVAYSCFRAGGMHEKADGVPKNVEKAIRLYQSACDNGYRNGCEAVNRLKSPGRFSALRASGKIAYDPQNLARGFATTSRCSRAFTP